MPTDTTDDAEHWRPRIWYNLQNLRVTIYRPTGGRPQEAWRNVDCASEQDMRDAIAAACLRNADATVSRVPADYTVNMHDRLPTVSADSWLRADRDRRDRVGRSCGGGCGERDATGASGFSYFCRPCVGRLYGGPVVSV